jgi:glutamate---cysteine ligase / carboxylate-amine ligase
VCWSYLTSHCVTIVSAVKVGRAVTTVNQPLTVGVEEEFFAVDSDTHGLLADTRPLLDSGHLRQAGHQEPSYSDELRPCMVESRTGICRTLDQVRAEVCDLRGSLLRAAEETGSRIVAAGSFPLADWRSQGFVPKPRNEYIAESYAQMAHEHVICACHVHIGVEDRDTAVQVMNRVRPWLPVLCALSSSSPFWMGEDTGYASYRTMVWERWPMAGIPPAFRSFDHYKAGVRLFVDTGTIADEGQIYWDIRPGTKYRTVEFRVADSCVTVDEIIVQAGLARALTRKCLSELERGGTSPDIRPELLRAGKWRSARFGLTGSLVDPVSAELVPARSLVDRLLEYVRHPLEEAGDWDEVTKLVERTKCHGTSAERQRRVFSETRRLENVVDLLISETAAL